MERERVNGVARNTDYWYELFDVKPTDKLYLAPEERVRIWWKRGKDFGERRKSVFMTPLI